MERYTFRKHRPFLGNVDFDKIKSYPIDEYARMIGLTPVKTGKYISLKEHDSVRIDPEKNCFWRNSGGVKGSIIDFSMEFEKKDIYEAIRDLDSLINGVQFEPVFVNKAANEKKPFALPKRGDNIKNAYAYLVGTRKIDNEIVNEFIKNKNLYQDENRNCVFVSYNKDGSADFACKRGTNTHKRFMADVPGNNYDRCFYIDNGAKNLIVTESVIDAMSVMSLYKQRETHDHKNYNYLALGGTEKYPAVLNHLKADSNIERLIIAVDADNAGFECSENIKKMLKGSGWKGSVVEVHPGKGLNDWNEKLMGQNPNSALEDYVQKSYKKSAEVEKGDEKMNNEVNLPDKSITQEQMKEYGYDWDGMLPLQHIAAGDLYENGRCAIYKLHQDDTEAMVEEADEIRLHARNGGIFGIEREDWERAKEHKPTLKTEPERSAEVKAWEDEKITGFTAATLQNPIKTYCKDKGGGVKQSSPKGDCFEKD